jgi:hypothetical protein
MFLRDGKVLKPVTVHYPTEEAEAVLSPTKQQHRGKVSTQRKSQRKAAEVAAALE